MGMTYKFVALEKGRPACDFLRVHDLHTDTIIDDMVFDREDSLFSWMEVENSDCLDTYGEIFVVKRKYLRNARAVLQGLLDRVAQMPFTKDNPARCEVGEYDENKKDYKRTYHGSPENIAILKEVEKVLTRTYHFTFPWQEPYMYDSVKMMVKALDKADVFMSENPDRVVIGMYY